MTLTSMRRLLWTTALLLGWASAQAATGSGKAATESRDATGFSAIDLRGGVNLIVRQGARESVQVSADDNLLPLLQTTIEGNGDNKTLRIQWKPGEPIRTNSKAVVTVDVVRLTGMASSGSGDIAVEAIKTPALSLSISGSSDARLNQLDTAQLTIGIAGSGDVRVNGKTVRLDVSIAGSGDVRARDLAADDVSISIAGSGGASVQANKTLAVSISGSGDVEYSGAAALAKTRVAGSGSIRQRQ
jgi:hypothetical protein